nr:aspartate/glutamate racemase family protein [uncultured Cohaesibacter sp.]
MEIQVLNPSSRTDTGITEDLQKSLHWLQGPWMPQVRCLTLEDGPCGISTARDSDAAAPAVIEHIERESGKADVAGFVVACFSDPGVFAARGITKKPVVGIGEAGFAAALALGDRFGTISVSKGGLKKLGRQVRHAGVSSRHAGHRDLGLDYGDLQYPDRVMDALRKMAIALRNEDGADVVLLAGAGLARYVPGLMADTGMQVIDPVPAAVSLVLGQLQQLAYGHETDAKD